MKKFLVILCAGIALHVSCKTQKTIPIVYKFPDNMAPHVKAGYVEMWEKGKILYGINCARCHSTYIKKKEVLPEFTDEQLQGYEVRVADPEHEMSVSEAKVTAEELNLITIFLTYRVRDSVKLKESQIKHDKDHSHQ